ncbi:MAG: hypothetical protein RR971_06115, partial [Alistipes sp.]
MPATVKDDAHQTSTATVACVAVCEVTRKLVSPNLKMMPLALPSVLHELGCPALANAASPGI